MGIYRVLDANLNRLREAFRVLEEFSRFFRDSEDMSVELKTLRHDVKFIANSLDYKLLISSRNSEEDVFSSENRPEELQRHSVRDVLLANMKRAQEASRVLEEYLKLTEKEMLSENAKKIRFYLYTLEKKVMEILGDE